MDSFEKFEDKDLPQAEAFYNRLSNKEISSNDYERIEMMWSHFNCRNLGEFQDICLTIDVLLLSVVFENFREMSIHEFELDPPHFFSSPGLTWTATLKYTGIEMDLLDDIDMVLLLEDGIRGGISSAMKRYCKANNPSIDGYDRS